MKKETQSEWSKKLVAWIIANRSTAERREIAMLLLTRYEQEMLYKLEEDRGEVWLGRDENGTPIWVEI